MLKFFGFLFHTFPLILSCLYLIVAILIVVVHIKDYKRKKALSIKQWFVVLLNGAYVLSFLVLLIFWFWIWESVFPFLGGVAFIASIVWSKYEDRRYGRRWWNW